MEEKMPDEAAVSGAPPAAKAEATKAVLPPTATVEDVADEEVPDPDEDDLDDLDDLLDDFSAAKIEAKAPAPPSGPDRPLAAAATLAAASAAPAAGTAPAATAAVGAGAAAEDEPDLDDLLGDADFAKQLQAGMADLLGEIQNSPEMQAQFENIFKELGAAATAPADGDVAAAAAATGAAAAAAAAAGGASSSSAKSAPAPDAASASASASADASFQETIRRTMARMQESGDQATAAAAADTSSTDDMLSEFMKQMQSGGLGGGANEEELSKMLVGMMEELTNKEILYEPMKELDDKFPVWMEQNKATTAADDLKRYEEQQTLVREIVTRFELATYSDANPADREYVVDRMQKMQAAGSPPPDLVGDMPSAQEALAAPEEACNPQ